MTRRTYSCLVCTSLWLASAVSLFGCGDEPMYNSDAGGTSVAAGSFAQEFERAICDFVTNCEGANLNSSSVLARAFQQNGGECRLSETTEGLDEIFERVNAGTIVYDAARASQCIQAARSCNFNDGERLCRSIFQSVPTEGQPCDEDGGCAPGLFCNGEISPDSCTPPFCQPRKALGESCSSRSECQGQEVFTPGLCGPPEADGLFFDDSVCLTRSSRAGAGEGETCGDVVENNHVVDTTCAPELDCLRVEDVDSNRFWNTGTCVPRAGLDASCEDIECAADLLCMGGVCRSFTVQNNVGDPCVALNNPERGSAQFCNEFLGLICIEGQCQNAGDGSRGSLCIGRGLNALCNDGLFCRLESPESAGTCEPQLEIGAVCSGFSDNECAGSGVFCDLDFEIETSICQDFSSDFPDDFCEETSEPGG